MNSNQAAGIAEHPPPFGFEATIERLEQAIAVRGLTLFAKMDHAEGAREAGLAMAPATVLIYGHPKGGTPVMVAAPLAALDLPLRVLVRQSEEGTTTIAFHPVTSLLAGAGVAPEAAAALEPAQHLLLAAIAP